jgi:DNA mismatch repair protein MutH
MLAYNTSMAQPVSQTPPTTETELLERARQLAGLRLWQLAEQLDEQVPTKLHHAKGWIGQLLEKALGATAGSLPEPDFQYLGIELKTLPVNRSGQPRESTYVCTVPLQHNHDLSWERSWVRNKLKRVLWVPIEADVSIPVEQRRIGQAMLWSPSPEQEAILRQDWEEHMDKICTGQLATISARDGQYLQIRPKAASSSSVITTHNEEGLLDLTLPRGFYLRTVFTEQVLKTGFHQAAI